MLRVSFVCLTLILAAGTKAQEEWDYTFNGNDWEGTCKTGKRQSPIDINTKWTSNKLGATPLQLINYDQEVPVTITENHHTIRVDLKDPSTRLAISGGGLRGVYVLQQMHFHWGSEHLLNSQRYALEAHLVHYRDIYGNRTDAAVNDPEGIAVLGVLYCLGSSNVNIGKVIEGLTNEVTLNFQDFLPNDLDFYRYQGSLTTPPCSEAVVWTVFKNRPTVSKQQVIKLKNSLSSESHSNYRNVQPLNRREIEKWEVNRHNHNKVHALKSTTNLLVAAPLLARNVQGIF